MTGLTARAKKAFESSINGESQLPKQLMSFWFRFIHAPQLCRYYLPSNR
jgi:hypothetical protein